MADSSSQVTITLPAPSALAVGDIIQVNGVGSGGWTIVQNGNSTIVENIPDNSATSTTGPINGGQYDAVELQYIGSSTFSVLNYTGNVVAVDVLTLPTGFVYEGGLTWMPPYTNSGNGLDWTQANTFCTTTVINGQTGWRLPTQPELSALYTSNAMNGQGWTLSGTWSSTPIGVGYHYIVGLSNGNVRSNVDTGGGYIVTCVR
jgi:hypothetical protein